MMFSEQTIQIALCFGLIGFLALLFTALLIALSISASYSKYLESKKVVVVNNSVTNPLPIEKE